MIEKIDLSKHMGKKEYKKRMKVLNVTLSELQRECKEREIPIIIVFEGWGASSKGYMINRLIEPLDPRGFRVYTTERPTEDELERPFLYRFMTKTPSKGRIAIFDCSWYRKVMQERVDGLTSNVEVSTNFLEINNFERLLTEDGVVLIKFFLHISKEEQKRRYETLAFSPKTAWRVTPEDWEQNRKYDDYIKMIDEMLVKTDQNYAPWTVIEAMDKEYACAKLLQTVVHRLSQVCEIAREAEKDIARDKGKRKREHAQSNGTPYKDEVSKEDCLISFHSKRFQNGVLNGIDLSLSLSKKEAKGELRELQKRLGVLQDIMYRKKVPMVIVFEGWDAAGKGGTIKRVTSHLDPRRYEVIPVSAPKEEERLHHYLWRFWGHMPRNGHIAIFDRSWYGRVLVERVEGLCTKEEWGRSYNEINHMEEHIANAGTLVLKFFLHIDKKEQGKRFKARQENPKKRWKITKEDWRNRKKWDSYEEAMDEMLVRTSTVYAPWIVVESNSKPYARVKVIRTIVEALEKKLNE